MSLTQTIGGSVCNICGTMIPIGGHSHFCGGQIPLQTTVPHVTTERYIGVTPDQVRQIIREELERAAQRR